MNRRSFLQRIASAFIAVFMAKSLGAQEPKQVVFIDPGFGGDCEVVLRYVHVYQPAPVDPSKMVAILYKA